MYDESFQAEKSIWIRIEVYSGGGAVIDVGGNDTLRNQLPISM